jgi:uncharacterized membrane protein
MSKNRLETFSDAVIAIILTIMVLELHVPHGYEIADLQPLVPIFLSYIFSFIGIGIYWNNHHHLLHVTKKINAAVMWANLHLLFWLSLLPFVTAWLGENFTKPLPVALYGIVVLSAGIAHNILWRTIVACQGKDSLLANAIGSDLKGTLSIVFYVLGISLAFVNLWFAYILYLTVAIMWLIPDRRIEYGLRNNSA